MRPFWLTMLLLSCTGDGPHRALDPRQTPSPALAGRAPADRDAQATAAPMGAHAAIASPPHAAIASPPHAAIASAATEPVAAAEPPAANPRDATRRAAHDALAEHCGSCHEGHRSTTPKALAVFDLDRADWPGRFDTRRYAAALRRLEGKPAARAAFVAFRDAELAAVPRSGS